MYVYVDILHRSVLLAVACCNLFHVLQANFHLYYPSYVITSRASPTRSVLSVVQAAVRRDLRAAHAGLRGEPVVADVDVRHPHASTAALPAVWSDRVTRTRLPSPARSRPGSQGERLRPTSYNHMDDFGRIF